MPGNKKTPKLTLLKKKQHIILLNHLNLHTFEGSKTNEH